MDKKIILILICLGLFGCQNQSEKFYKETYLHWAKHPEALKQTLMSCKSNNLPNSDICVAANNMALHFSDILSTQLNDPEEFGEKILNLETQCSKTPKLTDSTNQPSDHAKCEDIPMFLAAVGMSSPE